MPFGLIFGAVFYIALAMTFFSEYRSLPAGFALDVAEVSAALIVFGVAVGLLMRQRWARWIGVVVGVCGIWYGIVGVFGPEKALDWFVLAGSLTTAILLLIPKTGNVRRGLPDDARRHSTAGRALGYLVAVFVLVFMVALALGYRGADSWGISKPGAELGLNRIEWNDFGSGLAKAAEDGKPVFVDFYADWCAPCKMMDRKTFRHPSVLESMEAVVPIRVDVESDEVVEGYRGDILAEQYRVEVYPTLVLMDSQGREIERRTGGMPAAALVSWMDEALERARRVGLIGTAAE